MTMTSITIPIDSALAQIYDAASEQERRKIQLLVSLSLRDIGSINDVPLATLMDDISDRTQSRGLTPEILESLSDFVS